MRLWHLYVLIGVVAFFLTGSQALEYFDEGLVDGTDHFWRDAINANSASLFLVYDVLFLGLAVFVLMWVESRRVGIGAGWYIAYVALSLLIGISTFVPFFLAHRQRILDSRAAD